MELAKKLELIRTYLDHDTNILSEPNKQKIQLIEGDNSFKEAINYLKGLKPLKPLQWDENLAKSAKEHVDDIGPKGLLLYRSSDGTEPEDRISKYGKYINSLGENIDFGPNDAMGVIVSLTLDDGEEERPHRENMFKCDYQKVGIACGPHKTEFSVCVMDFAYDFIPLKKINNDDNYSFKQIKYDSDKISPIPFKNKNKDNNDNVLDLKNQLNLEKELNENLNKKVLDLEEKNRNLENDLNFLIQKFKI